MSAGPALCAKRKKAPPPPPLRATLQPSFAIPAEPLGFAAPGPAYLGARESLVSLDFIGEDRLLFTFRVPSLIERNPSQQGNIFERRIRALVLHLPDGGIEADTLWTVHDRDRYVYMLGNGQFLLRDRNMLSLGDASLQLKPFLQFPGPVLAVETDPAAQYLVTISNEPENQKPAAGTVGSPQTAQAQISQDDASSTARKNLVLRILRRDTGKVMLVGRIRDPIHLPINGDGYLEPLRAQGLAWSVDLNHFDGGRSPAGRVESICSPVLQFISAREFLATTCGDQGNPRLVALSVSGRQLWDSPPNIPVTWPRLAASANGLRLAWESLLVDHAVNAMAPLGSDDIKGQDVQVMDAATGKLVLRAAASPIFDAGGNVAISPSGRRVAIIMEGKVQVFDLPAPPPVNDSPPALHRASR
ncbi:MAG: hypothetical protein ACLGSD_13990 [Acidobacteriota bacterium]